MNSIKLFSIFTTLFILAFLGWMGTQSTPQYAMAFLALAFCTGARTVILYEDSLSVF